MTRLCQLFAVGRDSTFFTCPFHFEEVASKARDHAVPPYSLIQQRASDDEIKRWDQVIR